MILYLVYIKIIFTWIGKIYIDIKMFKLISINDKNWSFQNEKF